MLVEESIYCTMRWWYWRCIDAGYVFSTCFLLLGIHIHFDLMFFQECVFFFLPLIFYTDGGMVISEVEGR